jgi:hypothetical protein
MTKRGFSRDGFEARRRKEHFAFLVVKFLKAFTSFSEIYREFKEASRRGCLSGCGLFEKVKELEESLAFDLKEKAHALFRARAIPVGSSRSSNRRSRRNPSTRTSAPASTSFSSCGSPSTRSSATLRSTRRSRRRSGASRSSRAWSATA